MSQFEDLKQRLIAISQQDGASVSASSLTLSTNAPEIKDGDRPCTGCGAQGSGDHPGCGNGLIGPGSPGERQVNDPAQDSAPGVFPNITQSETTVARFGTFVVFGFNDSNNAANNNFTGYGFSSDSGVTWTDCGNPPKGTLLAEDGGDPVLAVDSQGIFYFSRIAITNSNESIIAVSTGQVDPMTNTFSLNDPFTAGVGEFPGGFQDKEWIAVGPDKNNPGAEALYVTWTDFTATTDTIRFSKFSTGVSPTQLIASKTIVPSSVSGFNPVQGSFPVVDSQGNIFVFYEAFTPNPPNQPLLSIRMVKSTDGGDTFSQPIIVAPAVGPAANVFLNLSGVDRFAISVDRPTNSKVIRTSEIPQATVAPDGTLYVVWNDGLNFPAEAINIVLAFSTNGGDTWTPVPITNTDVYQFMPSVIFQCDEAQIQYSKFNDPQNVGGTGDGTFALFKKSFSIANGVSAETMVSNAFSLVPVHKS